MKEDEMVDQKILDRATPAEEQKLLETKKVAEAAKSAAEATGKRLTRAEGKRDEKGKKDAAKMEALEAKAAEAKAEHEKAKRAAKIAETAFEKAKKETDSARAARAAAIQTGGRISKVTPHRRRGMYQVCILVGEGSERRSVTYHCRAIRFERVLENPNDPESKEIDVPIEFVSEGGVKFAYAGA